MRLLAEQWKIAKEPAQDLSPRVFKIPETIIIINDPPATSKSVIVESAPPINDPENVEDDRESVPDPAVTETNEDTQTTVESDHPSVAQKSAIHESDSASTPTTNLRTVL